MGTCFTELKPFSFGVDVFKLYINKTLEAKAHFLYNAV